MYGTFALAVIADYDPQSNEMLKPVQHDNVAGAYGTFALAVIADYDPQSILPGMTTRGKEPQVLPPDDHGEGHTRRGSDNSPAERWLVVDDLVEEKPAYDKVDNIKRDKDIYPC